MPALFSFGTTAWLAAALMAAVGSVAFTSHDAGRACSFDVIDATMYLEADCTTAETILVPDDMTLDGRGHTITAVDPENGHFVGAVIRNAGDEAHIVNVEIAAANLMDVCNTGDERLRGILLEGAHGTVKHVDISGVHQGASGCQEGTGIEVRNPPYDGTHPNRVNVEIEHNKIVGFQKGGIVINGDVWALIGYNDVGASATQQNLVANGIQLGFGASGDVIHNHVAGNQWCGAPDTAATAILAFATAGVVNVTKNKIGGNSDVGIYAFSDDIAVDGNQLTDDQFVADCNQAGYDIGIGNYGSNTLLDKNIIKQFALPLDGHSEGKNAVPKAGMQPKAAASPLL